MQTPSALVALIVALCVSIPAWGKPPGTAAGRRPADAEAFVARAEKEQFDFSLLSSRVNWINATYITEDTDAVTAEIGARGTEMGVRFAKEAARFDRVKGLSPDTRRKLDILKQSLTLPASDRPGAADELNTLATGLQSTYGKGKGTLDGKPINGSDIEDAMRTTRDPAKLREMWQSWHDNVGAPMRGDYLRLVGLANEGSKELGYTDLGAMWRSGYDMPADDFAALVDRLWLQVRPLYEQLHCYARSQLSAKYGAQVQSAGGPLRADLLGNMWAQEWGGIYDLVAPPGVGDVGFDLSALLVAKGYTPIKMFETGAAFYSSLGFAPLPATFWERSMLTKPRDREVVCHASAWDIDNKDDIRVKMCTKVNAEDFVTIHHELGHNYYQREYKAQPPLYLNGANDGFHEAIGDFVALSITPEYLVRIGLLDAGKVPSADKDVGLLLRQGLDKIAFLPFAVLMDKWRWGVFSGAIPADRLQTAWDELRLQYQGVSAPVARSATAFDPGAKYHIPGNTPYARYFLAAILQFQFYRAACQQAGWSGPLHRCSFFGNAAVGERFRKMLAMGASKPWPDALEVFTGSREMDGTAIIAYFQPLMVWLEGQNKGRTCGW